MPPQLAAVHRSAPNAIHRHPIFSHHHIAQHVPRLTPLSTRTDPLLNAHSSTPDVVATRGFCARFLAASLRADHPSSKWTESPSRESHRTSSDWRNGTGSGPFDWEKFEHNFRRDQWYQGSRHPGRLDEKYRKMYNRMAGSRGTERARRWASKKREKQGLAYFLLVKSPLLPAELYERGDIAPHSTRPTPNPFYSTLPTPSPVSQIRTLPKNHYLSPRRLLNPPSGRTFPLKTTLLGLALAARAPKTSLSARLFSSVAGTSNSYTRSWMARLRAVRLRCPLTLASNAAESSLQAAIPFLYPLVTILKSSAALNVITVVSRFALTLLPLSARSKVIYVLKERYLRNPDGASSFVKHFVQRTGATANSASARFNANFLLPFLIALPLLLLGVTVIASFERTPVTGRRRIVMLSPEEEAQLVTSVLSVGETTEPGARDWVAILSSVLDLGDEGISPITGRRILLGGDVLDARDWRVRWTTAVLSALEAGIPGLAGVPGPANPELLVPPPSDYPLELRLDGEVSTSPVQASYDLVLIDRKEPNAFSFGFGPDHLSTPGRRGVIVIYTGFLDEILGDSQVHSLSDTVPSPSPTSSIFSGIFTRRRVSESPDPSNLMPATLPTPEQTKSLAVLLSHELSHLVLSHTLESYASTSLLIPHVSKLLSDVARTLIYPVTVLLGPFVQDAIGQTLHVGATDGFGILGRSVNSCESRKLEQEADLVALRILALSGVDPRFALDFWQERLDTPNAFSSTAEAGLPHHPSSHLFRLHTASKAEQQASASESFLQTHPVDQQRVEAIKKELNRWIAYHALRAKS